MGLINVPVKTIGGQYDFAKDGGLQGQILLNAGETIPLNAVIWYGVARVDDALTSGGAATISVDLTGIVGGLVAALAVASWGANAIIEGIALGTASQGAVAELQILMTIATADLTAGVFRYNLAYFDFGRQF